MKKIFVLVAFLSLMVFIQGKAEAVTCSTCVTGTSNLTAVWIDTPTVYGHYIAGRLNLKEVMCRCNCDFGKVEIILSPQSFVGHCMDPNMSFTYNPSTDFIAKIMDLSSGDNTPPVMYADARGFDPVASFFPGCGIKTLFVNIPIPSQGILGIGSGIYHVYVVFNNSGTRTVLACGGNL